MTLRKVTALVLLTLPMAVLAGPYKCKAADGKVSYQDQPCQGGSAGSQITIDVAPADPKAVASLYQSTTGETSAKQRNAEAKARNDQIDAHNRTVRCNNARRSLGVLKEQRPVFRYDNKGERQYLDDASRQSEIVAAKRSVAESCN
jgi:hypothetical protein